MITLVIIGVIASMTIPTLIKKTENQEFVSKFKKNYSVLSSALKMAQAQNGMLTGWDWSTQQKGYDNVENYILPHLQIAENFKNEKNVAPDYDWKNLHGDYWFNLKSTGQYKIILNDGAIVVMYCYEGCTESNNQQCLDIHVDVNGPKGPNRRGRDIFTFSAYPYTNDLFVLGVRKLSGEYNFETGSWEELTKNEIDNDCQNTSNGLACGAKIILEGYKMNY